MLANAYPPHTPPLTLIYSHTSLTAHTHPSTPSCSAETGFKHVVPVEYVPRLLHFHGEKRRIEVREKEPLKCNLDSSDVFILDMGLTLYQVRPLYSL